jgi:hypothetical protein
VSVSIRLQHGAAEVGTMSVATWTAQEEVSLVFLPQGPTSYSVAANTKPGQMLHRPEIVAIVHSF